MKKFLSLLVVLLTTFSSAWADNNYLCFTAEEANSSVTFKWVSGSNVQTSNDGTNFTDYIAGTAIPLEHVGDKVYFKGANIETSDSKNFTMSGKIAASGDVTSLTNGTGGDVALNDRCYRSMFDGCTSLTKAPNLPATKLAYQCYNAMFWGCTSLTTAPELPATKLEDRVYNLMFNGCTSLTTVPNLPATTLTSYCYSGMFRGCTSLTTAPELPATTLAEHCYDCMFSGCTSLTTAPELPGTKLVKYCYNNMFFGCTSLTTAPELPATTLVEDCYWGMFNGCSKLSKVTVKFTDWNTTNESTTDWLKDAGTDASVTSRTFICPAGLDVTTTKDVSHVPTGWYVVNKQVSTPDDLTTAVSNATTGEVIQLTSDIDLTSTIMVASGKDFTLDLNGHVLNAGNLAQPQSSGDYASVIYIGYGGNLKITDSNPDATHTQEGLADVKGGVLTGGKGTITNYNWGGAIFNQRGTLTMMGGTICGNTARCGGGIFNSGTATISNVIITNNSSEYGGGVGNQGSLTIENCSITQNTSTFTPGIWQQSGTLTLKGKNIIKDNTYYGINRNIYLYNGAKLSLDGLTEGSEIGITTSAGQCQFTNICSAEDMQYFTSDDNSYAFWYNTDHLETRSICRADADLDTDFSVNDYSKVLNYTLTPATVPAYPTKNILFLNADANADTNIDVSDFTVIVEKIFNAAVSKAKALAPLATAESVDGLNVNVSGNVLTISADNASAFLAAQMDITLPEGITIASAQSAGHTIYNKVQEDGSTRVLIAGLQNNQFSGNTVATITLSGNVESADVDNCVFTNSAFQSVAAEASSITAVVNIDADVNVNNDGKFIENGKVVILKNGKKFSAAGQQVR